MSQLSEVEEAAAKWLEARASGNVRAWRDASTKLDQALAELHRAAKAAKLQSDHQ